MKYGINRVTLVGNVGETPRIAEKEGEILNCTFSLATSDYFKDKNGEEIQKTEWHRIIVWNKQASIVQRYVKKGDSLYIEGRIHNDSYDDKDGNRRFKTEIVCENFLFLTSKNQNGADA